MPDKKDFPVKFSELTGDPPFKWQCRLFQEFVDGRIPSHCDIPTGLGKTAVMTIWYLALRAKVPVPVPRRLVYVVDRRAVVDQATTIADEIKKKSTDDALRVSTLRGQHVDNRAWLADPAAPAIIVGTIDMIGSRLLFSGYGVSRKMRPYHAGFLGADTLVVLDEAHLCPPFEALLKAIATDPERQFSPGCPDDSRIIPPCRLLSLSATGRNVGADKMRAVFRLEPEDCKEPIVAERLAARKRLTVEVLDDANALVRELAKKAILLAENDGSARTLVYCNSRDVAEKTGTEIKKQAKNKKIAVETELFVGARRVKERVDAAERLKELGFLAGSDVALEKPAFLIATSAGEVGVDLDADHMVCDLVEWERMVQRLGRVNRRGKGDACVTVFAAPHSKEKPEDWIQRRACLRAPLDVLPPITGTGGDARDASPGAIMALTKKANGDEKLRTKIDNATTTPPLYPALTRALIDAWSMTSLGEHTGRPDIQPWLRGWEDEKPQTTVVWRSHLPVREGGADVTEKEIKDFFEAAPLHTSEMLETETYRVVKWLADRARVLFKDGDRTDGEATSDALAASGVEIAPSRVVACVLSSAGDLRSTLRGSDLAPNNKAKKEKLKNDIIGATLVVDARCAGLTDGMLDPKEKKAPHTIDDGKDWLCLENGNPVIRFRVRSVAAGQSLESDRDWRERLRFATEQTEEGEALRWLIVEKWRHDAATEDDRSAGDPQELAVHHASTECAARDLAEKIGLLDDYVHMLAIAARLHDEGKRHERWQRAFNAPRDGRIFAKTNGPIDQRLLDGYRHEFGSLPLAGNDADFMALPAHRKDLVLHLIAAHHGRARPVISTTGCDDAPSALERRAREVALRFARLQKRWGPWGLAWWEGLLRAADQQASRANDEHTDVQIKDAKSEVAS